MADLKVCYKDVIVHDEYLNDIGEKIEAACAELNTTYDKLIKILLGISIIAVREGQTHDAIIEFMNKLNSMKGQINQAGKSIDTNIQNYIYDIDEKDKYLYD